jgi:putative ABC transport system permease protein
MGWIPLHYALRSVFRRGAATVLTITSIGATVAVLAGVLALQQGFAALFTDNGRRDLVVILRPGALAEGESGFSRAAIDELIKSAPEFAQDQHHVPIAAAESYLAVRLRRSDGGETNVPIRGIQPATFVLRAAELRIIAGRMPEPGQDEAVVGRALVGRIGGARIGETLVLNTTPVRVVGVFACPGPFESEVWVDVERMMAALDRPFYNRVIAQLASSATVEQLARRLENDPRTPARVLDERSYLTAQTGALSVTLLGLATFLALVMGTAAVFTGTNTMLAAIAARSQEIGVLLALGFRPVPIFVSFLCEALLLGLAGGMLGCLLVLPVDGLRTGTTNFNTFTEVAFAFRVTPTVLGTAVGFALLLGLLGGCIPAWRAAHLRVTQALRRG